MRLGLYAVAAVAAAALAASAAMLVRAGSTLGAALAIALPPSLLLGILGLASRYSCRAMPLRRTSVTRVLATHAGAAAAAGGVWVLVWNGWWGYAGGVGPLPEAALLFGIAMALYAVAVIVHYLVLEIEAAREAEEAALRFQVLAREAELSAFKAQVDPHFLFNSLNAVASLCGSRPEAAREMATRMAEFFRLTLRLGARPRITLGEELDLVSRYLAIEKVRFGDRLTMRVEADEGASACLVPPLLLQPLVENSVRHGIASMVDGGSVEMSATRRDGLLRIRIENPADPDRERTKGEGIGLQNARERLRAISDGRATLNATESGGRFRVEIELPS